MVWRPTVILSNDWVPYRSGRWAWRGGDYVWISSESWGWAPYHYGRWTVIASLGWCWIPPSRGDVYWGPGYVGWYRSGSHVAWTPLAPGETFYGYGHYGRNSVNITTTTININTVEYRNRRHQGGVTVVAQSDFVKGRPVTAQSSQHMPPAVSVAVGSPRVRPVRAVDTTSVSSTPTRGNEPRIEQRDSRELSHRFPRVVAATPDTRGQSQQATRSVTPPQTASAPQQHDSQRLNPPVAVRQQPVAASGDKGRQVGSEKQQKQRKVWRVKSTENGKEKGASPERPKGDDGKENGSNSNRHNERTGKDK
jgi:hypothetical protein